MARPRLVAHRGQARQYPENSLPAITAALRCGAPYVEFDLQSTADGILVVSHDSGLQRTCGVAGDIRQLQATRLSGISCHEPDRLGARFLPTPIPTLEQIVLLLQEFSDARALVEIKQESLERFGIEPILGTLLRQLAPLRDRFVVISYQRMLLQRARQRSGCPIGWILERYDPECRQIAERLQPDYLILDQASLPAAGDLWDGPWRWVLYDLTDPQQILACWNRGIDLVETRDICTLLRHPLLQQPPTPTAGAVPPH